MDLPFACQESQQLAKSALFRYGILVKALLCPICIVIGVIFTKKKGLAWLGNPSTKVLFLFHMFWAVEVPATYMISYAFDGIRYLLPTEDPCGYVIKAYIGFPMRAVPGIGITIQTISMLSFAIERAISTTLPGFFDRKGSLWLGIALASSMTLINITFWVYRVVFNANFDDNLIISTVWTSTNFQMNLENVWVYLILELSTAFIFTITLFVNKRLSRKYTNGEGGISRKYQINENLRVMMALMPCFYVHVILSGFQYFGIQIRERVVAFHDIPPAAFQEIFCFQPFLYILVIPVVLHWFLKRQSRVVVDSHQERNHFKQIELQFEEHFQKKVATKKRKNLKEKISKALCCK